MIEFLWEREAMEGQPTPKDLSLTDQKAYQALASLYGRYRMGLIDRATGSIEKARILAEWNMEKQICEAASELAKWHARLRKEIEGAQNRYQKDRTLENADKLSRVLDGIFFGGETDMTREEAAEILDPETSRNALWKYEGEEQRLEACNEACRIASAALRAQQTPLDRSRREGCDELLHSDGTNDRANQIIDAFDMAPDVEAEPLPLNEALTPEELGIAVEEV